MKDEDKKNTVKVTYKNGKSEKIYNASWTFDTEGFVSIIEDDDGWGNKVIKDINKEEVRSVEFI